MANTFGDVSFEQFQSGDFVIIPLRAYQKAGADPDDDSRSAHIYEIDLPDSNLSAEERFLWGALPMHNGRRNGSYHWHHERLAFDLKSRRVTILPRRGLSNVDPQGDGGTHFWCTRDVVAKQTITIDSWDGRGHILPLGEVCPTAFVRSTRETKGVPLWVNSQREAYVIDTQFVAALIAELELDDEVTIAKGAATVIRQQEKAAQVQEDVHQSIQAEQRLTRNTRGQAAIDEAELGARLCADIQVGGSSAVVSGFLEGVSGANIQIRVNSVQSPDGSSTYTLTAPIDGVLYAPGSVVWSDRTPWRACK